MDWRFLTNATGSRDYFKWRSIVVSAKNTLLGETSRADEVRILVFCR